MAEPVNDVARLRAELWKTLDDAKKTYSRRIVCEHHPKYDPAKGPSGQIPDGANANGNWYHQAIFEVPDVAGRVKVIDSLLNRLEGKPGQQPQKEPPARLDERNLDDLTAEEIAVRIAALRAELEETE